MVSGGKTQGVRQLRVLGDTYAYEGGGFLDFLAVLFSQGEENPGTVPITTVVQ